MGRSFNGTSQALRTVSTLDFSATNAMTASWWYFSEGTIGANDIMFELSDDYNGVATGLIFNNNTTDPSPVNLGVIGNVGANNGSYAALGAAYHHYAGIYDKSQATNEVAFYIDGSVQTIGAPVTNNNTNSFGDLVFNIMSRGSTTLFNPGRIASFALYNIALSGSDITSLSNGTSPQSVQAANLKFYWELAGYPNRPGLCSGREQPAVGGVDLARYDNGGTPIDHPTTIAAFASGVSSFPSYKYFPKNSMRESLSPGRLL